MIYSYNLKGVEDSFSELISNITPNDTYLVSNTKKNKINTPSFSWQTDILNVTPNPAMFEEGSDLTNAPTLSSTKELTNFTQIFRKAFVITDTVAATKAHGRTSEEDYQYRKAGKELKNWMESVFLSSQAGAKGATGASSKTACLGAQVAAVGVSDPDTGATVHKKLTAAPKTADIIDITTQLFIAGSSANTIVVNNVHADVINDAIKEQGLIFGNNGLSLTTNINGQDVMINTLTDNLGQVWTIIYNRFCPQKTIYFLNPDDISQEILREPELILLGKYGSSSKYMCEIEVGLRVSNPYAIGMLEWA